MLVFRKILRTSLQRAVRPPQPLFVPHIFRIFLTPTTLWHLQLSLIAFKFFNLYNDNMVKAIKEW